MAWCSCGVRRVPCPRIQQALLGQRFVLFENSRIECRLCRIKPTFLDVVVIVSDNQPDRLKGSCVCLRPFYDYTSCIPIRPMGCGNYRSDIQTLHLTTGGFLPMMRSSWARPASSTSDLGRSLFIASPCSSRYAS